MKRSYGQIKFDESNGNPVFLMSAEPQVQIKLKRVFPKIEQEKANAVRLAATDENCLELLWFFDRYPLEMQPDVLEILKSGKQRFAKKQNRLEKIISGPYKAPKLKMQLPAREYQDRAAALWLANNFLILGDDVGLGKTCSAICGFMDARTLPALVVTMTHLPQQWQREISLFAPSLSAHIIKSGPLYELPNYFGNQPDVLICNYHKLEKWQSVFADYCKSAVFDECQELRRKGTPKDPTQKYQAAKNICERMQFAMGMSATPIYNFGNEIFNIANCLNEGWLGSEQEFEREWCSWGGRIEKPKAFGAYLRDNYVMLRRTRSDVGRELQPLTRIVEMVECDDKPIDDIRGKAAELARIILGGGPGLAIRNASRDLDWMLRQATGIGKAYSVAAFVRMLVESGQQVLLGGWHRAVYEIWKEQLGTLGVAMFTGTESTKQKTESKEAFINGDARILIMSVRSGAGLDGLQHVCKSVVVGELDWSPAVHHQFIGRIDRDGQKEPVMAWFLVTDSGSDPIVMEKLGVKRDQSKGVTDPTCDLVDVAERQSSHTKDLARQFLKGKK